MTDKQPIPVAEAMEAMRAAIALCPPPDQTGWDAVGCSVFCVAARAGYAGALEYLRGIIEYESQNGYRPMKEMGPCNAPMLYHAVAPIVAWHREQGGKR